MAQPRSSQKFVQDQQGMAAIIFGLSALPLFGVLALAIESGGISMESAEFDAWVDEACARTNSAFFASQDVASRAAAADQVIAMRSSSATGLPNDFGYSVSEVSGGVQIDLSGTQSGIVGRLSAAYDVTVDCRDRAGGPELIFAETFENPQVDAGWSWQVYSAYPNWTVDEGYGPQVIVGGIDGVHPTPFEGAQYVELDSNWHVGGTGLNESSGSELPGAGQIAQLNTAISREVFLSAGTYELTYVSRRKFFLGLAADYRIGVYFEPVTAANYSSQVALVGDEFAWTQHLQILNVATDGNYRIGFRAEGYATKFGGLLDDIRLVRQ